MIFRILGKAITYTIGLAVTLPVFIVVFVGAYIYKSIESIWKNRKG